MKKLILSAFVCLLLIGSVSAYGWSIRGSQGEVQHVNYDYDLETVKVKFSWNSNWRIGGGTLQIIALDEYGKRIVLNTRFDDYGKGVTTYYKQGEGRPQRYDTHTIVYPTFDQKIRVYIRGGVNAQVIDIPMDWKQCPPILHRDGWC